MKRMNDPIHFFSRISGRMEEEAIYGERFLRWAYGSCLGRLSVALLICRPLFSWFYGRMMDLKSSRKKILPFIEKYQIDMDTFKIPEGDYDCFNAFFYRHLKHGARVVDSLSKRAAFPADGRHLAIADHSSGHRFYLKGENFDLVKLVGDRDLAESLKGGSILISRLCPVDYHRFHFPVSGEASESVLINGYLRSVSPLALRQRLSILWENRRMRTTLQSPQFGTVVMIEIGATCVGSIIQTYRPGPVEKGDEKGYFAFGGSCVVTIFQKGAICFDQDLLDHSAASIEVFDQMGKGFAVSTQ